MRLIQQKNKLYTVLDNNGILLPMIIAKKHNDDNHMKYEVDRLEKIKHIYGVVRIITYKKNIIFLEKIDGDDLYNILEKRKKLLEYEVRHIARCLLKIVYSIHNIGIIHGDIKPSNIMYNEITKKVTLVDFEYRRHTEKYASPEILQYNYIKESSDIWSIGVTIYTLLMGYNPYNSKLHLLSGIPIHPMDPHISTNAYDFIMECLNIDHYTRISIIECINHPYIKKQSNYKKYTVSRPFITLSRSVSLNNYRSITTQKELSNVTNTLSTVDNKCEKNENIFSCCLIS